MPFLVNMCTFIKHSFHESDSDDNQHPNKVVQYNTQFTLFQFLAVQFDAVKYSHHLFTLVDNEQVTSSDNTSARFNFWTDIDDGFIKIWYLYLAHRLVSTIRDSRQV